MRVVTLQGMREYTAKWLREERATRAQTLALLDAVYGGAINGIRYAGRRSDEFYDTPYVRAPRSSEQVLPEEERQTDDNQSCGCLVDTLERIRNDRPVGKLHRSTAMLFNLAVKIPLGATPSNNPWARAAAQGIEDYYAAKGWR